MRQQCHTNSSDCKNLPNNVLLITPSDQVILWSNTYPDVSFQIVRHWRINQVQVKHLHFKQVLDCKNSKQPGDDSDTFSCLSSLLLCCVCGHTRLRASPTHSHCLPLPCLALLNQLLHQLEGWNRQQGLNRVVCVCLPTKLVRFPNFRAVLIQFFFSRRW